MTKPLSSTELDEKLKTLDGWEVVEGRLHKELHFADFNEAFGFMTRLALVAERFDHHPDWSNSWNTVVIDITSHAAGGITDDCIRLAHAADSISVGH